MNSTREIEPGGGRAAFNFAWATAIVDAFVHAGVRHAVLSPGAQMAPISLACRGNPLLRCSIVIDERSAAFFALGLAKATGTPPLLICTSGSAVGQWYPAIIEASEGQVPLILLSCDKSPSEHGRAVAQTIEQTGIYGGYVRASRHFHLPDASIGILPSLVASFVEKAQWPVPGPVHLNVPFEEPLIPRHRRRANLPQPPRFTVPTIRPDADDLCDLAAIMSGQPGLIICGPEELQGEAAAMVARLAAEIRCPLIADASSGVRFGRHDRSTLVTHADAFLRAPRFITDAAPHWILRFGGTPTSKPILKWLAECGAAHHVVVDQTAAWPDPVLRTTRVLRGSPAVLCREMLGRMTQGPAEWLDTFLAEERRAEGLLAGTDGPFWESAVIRQLVAEMPAESTIFIGNSTPVRDFDGFSGTGDRPIRLVANRGTNGIDGSIAVLLGLAAASSDKVVGYIGDMAFAHDVGSLQLAQDTDTVLIVINNGGGAIFEYQPVAGIPEFRDFLAPPTVDIGAAAIACRWRHHAVDDLAGFRSALRLALAKPGPDLIEVIVDRKSSVDSHRQFWNDVAL
ncbi:MAG TPA: 2-succinyl-5-enolpyruvyl-6-hydroxy-3-cyclohexene-1-carboxylic-acid synthase [Aliidongia sp.]|nr:2-succinyl-5-enolpyruvyl-6-hydroxy-3-cyclohexene-1-carboxylic-acid synthase [Aliidongia sp.]